MAAKCFYCKTTGVDIAHVKACATSAKIVTEGAENAPVTTTTTKIVEIAASIATGTAAALAAPAVKIPFIPEHRKAKMALIAAQAAAPAPVVAPVVCEEPAPALKAVLTGQDLELGMYQIVNEAGKVTVYKVKWNKTKTYKYAEVLWITQKEVWDSESQTWKTVPKGKFVFAGGIISKLTSDNKMTDADAKAFHDTTKKIYGVDYGFCCVCAKLLTVKKSIAAGIGPVCQSKL